MLQQLGYHPDWCIFSISYLSFVVHKKYGKVHLFKADSWQTACNCWVLKVIFRLVN